MKNIPKLLICLLSFLPILAVKAQEIPLVYDVENTGADCSTPILPDIDRLPDVRPLPDPFEWADRSGRSIRFEDWTCRRAEIKAEIEHYEIGEKPERPENITAGYADDTLTVKITVNGNTLTLTSAVTLPSGNGPFPAVIGIGRGSGSLPPDIFTSRNVAQIAFDFRQVMSHTQTRGEEPINQLYPGLIHIGAYSAWSWGISRLIDGLELVRSELNIDLRHLAVTGCSFAGKMALFAGAFDERIALTIAQESGGGGAAAWRVSETLGNVETLGKTSHAWFIEDMFQFSNSVHKLPFDHHELMAMVAPRALLVLGNPDYEWLADESGYVSCRAAHEVWKAFGVPERFGFSIVGGHNHCRLPESQYPEVEAFVDKFLLVDQSTNTDVQIHPFEAVNYERWYQWWGSGEPDFLDIVIDSASIESDFYEMECATHGPDWNIVLDSEASNGSYATIKTGLNSPDSAVSGNQSTMNLPFSINMDTTYYVFARVNCPSPQDDSFWVRFDNNEFVVANGLGTRGWQWVLMTKAKLEAGDHDLTIAYREDGALIDKINITNFAYGPEALGMEKESLNLCTPESDR